MTVPRSHGSARPASAVLAMFRPHPECIPPDNPNVPIWRYIDFAKFVDMLERRKLHFARLDQLGDEFEGAPSAAATEWWRLYYAQRPATTTGNVPGHVVAARDQYYGSRGLFFVNCWHMNEHESHAMWRLYSHDGIAIRSTYSRLLASVDHAAEDVHIGRVVYHDHRRAIRPENPGNILSAAFRKGMSFEHERELRALTDRVPPDWTGGSFPYDEYKDKQPKGVMVDVDLDGLLERVYVAPGRPPWFKELVVRVMETYKLDKPVETSSLDDRPDIV